MKRIATLILASLLLAACGDPQPPAGAKFAQNGEMKVHWTEQGEGTPIVLVMGHRYSSRMWYPVVPALAQSHRVITLDNRGTGYSSTASEYEIGDMAKDVFAVMDAAKIESAHVYGVSLGGGIVLEMAMEQPQRVKSLILGCTRLKTEVSKPSGWMKKVIYHLPHWLANWAMTRPGKAAASAANPLQVEFANDVLRSDPYDASGVNAQSAATGRYAATKEAAAKLTMPALVLHGDEDKAVPYEAGVDLSKSLPNARLETFKGAGHNYFLAYRERANKVVLDFVQQVDGAQPVNSVAK